MRLEVQERRLDELAIEIGRVDDLELKSHLSKYLCILISGFIENYIKELVLNLHERNCKKEISKFITSKVRGLTNLDDPKLIAFLETFNEEWARRYKAERNDEMEAALNNIYAQRNAIAHGNASNSNITYLSIVKYFTLIKELLNILKAIIKK
ncbi:HEPN domain-containing protein [Pedobacter jeongneungensis]|uniref:HEPN domain-containing protein n=1 Tax=Pedobacter jeongneungensis TaxID=947309 RepID=UPI00046A44AE|nr:HEPN domain-containing protein [Pedobacter jeongneungensis]